MSDIDSYVAASGFGSIDRESRGHISPNHRHYKQLTPPIALDALNCRAPACLQKVIDSLNLLHPDGGVRNLRVLQHRGGMASLFFTDTEELANEVMRRDGDSNVKTILVQLQEIDAAAVESIADGEGVSLSHIAKYNWFVLDADIRAGT
jgi:hypothetical protein